MLCEIEISLAFDMFLNLFKSTEKFSFGDGTWPQFATNKHILIDNVTWYMILFDNLFTWVDEFCELYEIREVFISLLY